MILVLFMRIHKSFTAESAEDAATASPSFRRRACPWLEQGPESSHVGDETENQTGVSFLDPVPVFQRDKLSTG